MNHDEQHIINSLQKNKTELPSDDYFAALQNNLFAEIEKETKVIPLYRRWWVVSSAAASVVFILVFSFIYEQEKTAVTDPDWNSVSKDEMFAYIENNIHDFETEDLAEQLNEIPEWNATNVSITARPAEKKTTKITKLFDELSKDEILEYLQEDVTQMDDETITGY